MPSPENLRSRKRRLSCTDFSLELSQPGKKSKTAIEVELNCGHRPPRFWDTLSRIRLSRGAIREFERRTSGNTKRHKTPCYSDLQQINVARPGQLGRFSRHGGPDLNYLRGFGTLTTTDMGGRKRSSTSRLTKESTKNSSPYNGDFEQKLTDNGIYFHNRASKPNNLQDIREHLAKPRPSLSPSRFNDQQFEEFAELCARPAKEAGVMADIIPIIAGEGRRRHHSMTDVEYTYMSPIAGDVTAPKPDIYDGAQPEQIDLDVRTKLGRHIVPSNETSYPAAPNFFVEGKSAKGRADVAKRQACHDGAVGARAMHTLQNYKAHRPTYDGNAYSFSSTYHAGTGTLQMYAHHLTAPNTPGGRPEYHATLIDAYALPGNRRSFCEGAGAFRHERELAESYRNSFIENANRKARQARHASTSSPSTTLPESQGSRSVLHNDSDTSADELVLEDVAKKRHRHSSSMGQDVDVRPPLTLSKPSSRHADGALERRRDNVAPKHNGGSQHTVIEGRDKSKRPVRPTQKVLDGRRSGTNYARAVPKGRHDL